MEDNEINRMLLRERLSADYQVMEAENGLEALSVLKEQPAKICAAQRRILLLFLNIRDFPFRLR